MALFDSLKNRQKIKEETARATETKKAMYADWNHMIQQYSTMVTAPSNDIDSMLRSSQGQAYTLGAVKKVPAASNRPAGYEFLFVYQQPDGQLTSSYYRMTPMGSFKSDRILGSLQIEYLSNVNGKDIPCTATINTSTQELLNIHNVPITPMIHPAISSISPEQCPPNMNEFYEIMVEFAKRENLLEASHSETTADFMPGTGRDF